MNQTDLASELRARRRLSGLTQRRLAEVCGVPQPNIAAYESGRRVPTAATIAKLESGWGVPSLARLADFRDRILQLAHLRSVDNVRIFGSVARGEAGPGSDVDLLVTPRPEASVFDLAAFQIEVSDLVGIPIDVVSDRGNGPVMERILAEARPL